MLGSGKRVTTARGKADGGSRKEEGCRKALESWSLPHPLLSGDKYCLPLPFRDQHHKQATCWQTKSPHEKKSKMELEIRPQRDCLLPGLLPTVNLRTVPEPRINPTRKGGIKPEGSGVIVWVLGFCDWGLIPSSLLKLGEKDID